MKLNSIDELYLRGYALTQIERAIVIHILIYDEMDLFFNEDTMKIVNQDGNYVASFFNVASK